MIGIEIPIIVFFLGQVGAGFLSIIPDNIPCRSIDLLEAENAAKRKPTINQSD